MAENKITLELDMDDISAQLAPITDALDKHYKGFLESHSKIVEKLDTKNREYQERITETLKNHERSMNDFVSTEKKVIADGVKAFREEIDNEIKNFQGQSQNVLEDVKAELKDAVIRHETQAKSVVSNLSSQLMREIRVALESELKKSLEQIIKDQMSQYLALYVCKLKPVNDAIKQLESRLSEHLSKIPVSIMHNMQPRLSQMDDNLKRNLLLMQQDLKVLQSDINSIKNSSGKLNLGPNYDIPDQKTAK